MHRATRSGLATVATALAALAATACGSTSPPKGVASVPPTSAHAAGGTTGHSRPTTSTTRAGAARTTSRPREQLDENPSQLAALYAPYNSCLAAHGLDRRAAPGSGSGAGNSGQLSALPATPPSPATVRAAQAACAHLKPLPPWQYDPSNPKALGFVEQVVVCLHAHGVRFAQAEDPPGQDRIEISLGGPQNDPTSISKGLEYIPVCNQLVERAQSGGGSA